MIKNSASNFFSVILFGIIIIFLFLLFIPYPLPVALRTLGNFLANFSFMDLINNSMFQIFLISMLSFAFLMVIYWLTTGNKKGNTFWSLLIIPINPIYPISSINQYNDVWNPFNSMVQLADYFPYIMLFLLFLIFIWKVLTHERGVNRKGLL